MNLMRGHYLAIEDIACIWSHKWNELGDFLCALIAVPMFPFTYPVYVFIDVAESIFDALRPKESEDE
ncbi:hypothetical protein KAR91_51600 [Candidatus Pacearchaeota archaeon]|nr:hypothetical protein [Candidatus Pacearchaeota archaeon]